MKKLFKKSLKLLFSSGAIITTTSASLVSCHHNNKPQPKNTWNSFKDAALKEKADQIVANDRPELWKDATNFKFLGDPKIDLTLQSITVTINSPKFLNLNATFTIIYKSSSYNVTDWIYNSDITGMFATNETLPTLTTIKQIVKIDDVTYVISTKGLYSSINNGATFSKYKLLAENTIPNTIVKINKKIYLGTTKGLYSSDDDLKTIKNIYSLPTSDSIKTIKEIDNEIYAITFAKGLFFSNDDGATFAIESSIPIAHNFVSLKQIDDNIYAILDSGVIYCADIENRKFVQNNTLSDAKNIYDVKKLADAIYVFGDYIYRSKDDGKTFIKNESFIKNNHINIATEINNKLYFGTQSGLYISIDYGISFNISTYIPEDATITQINKFKNSIIYVTTTNYGLYYDLGERFVNNDSVPSTVAINMIFDINNTIYLGTTNSGLYSSLDNVNEFLQNNIIPKKDYINKIVTIDHIIYLLTGNSQNTIYQKYIN